MSCLSFFSCFYVVGCRNALISIVSPRREFTSENHNGLFCYSVLQRIILQNCQCQLLFPMEEGPLNTGQCGNKPIIKIPALSKPEAILSHLLGMEHNTVAVSGDLQVSSAEALKFTWFNQPREHVPTSSDLRFRCRKNCKVLTNETRHLNSILRNTNIYLYTYFYFKIIFPSHWIE